MRINKTTRTSSAMIGAFVVSTMLAGAAFAQSPAPAGPSPAERAIEYRQAVFTVIGGNFGPIGGMMQGRAPFNGPDAVKRAQRLAAMAGFLEDAFPEISRDGNTKAKAEIWSNRAEFDKLAKDFADHTAALAAVLTKDNSSASDAFKKAAAAVGNDCKSCHDKFRAK